MMKRYQLFLAMAIGLAVLVLAACGLASSQDHHPGTGHQEYLVSIGPVDHSPFDRTIAIEANDQMRFTPESLTVQAGETIRFEVINRGLIPHEFIIGDAHIQEEHAQAMAAGGHHGDMHHGELSTYALTIPPGETAALVYTFDKPSTLLYGCHIPGHYAAGMKGTITIAAAQ